MDRDNKKIPICIDEATPYQRDEFEPIIDKCPVKTSNNSKIEHDEINKYEWGGQRLVGRDHKVFYTSLKIFGAKGESVEIKTGNHITIENQDNRKQPFVAKVNKFYEDTKKETDKKRCLVEWLVKIIFKG